MQSSRESYLVAQLWQSDVVLELRFDVPEKLGLRVGSCKLQRLKHKP